MKRGLYCSLILFVIACCLPALEWNKAGQPNDAMYGLQVLVVGWSGIFAGVIAWYANPLWAFGLFFGALRKPVLTAVVGALAIAIGATTIAWIAKELPADEGGVTKMAIVRLLPGCYVWFASLAVLPIAALLPKTK